MNLRSPESPEIVGEVRVPTKKEIEAQLGRILGCNRFSGLHRLRSFLEFIVGQTLQGHAGSLKEYSIAIDVFEKPETFDPKLDGTVRTAARRLRSELARYYATEGAADPVEISLPKGGYVPYFTNRQLPVEEPKLELLTEEFPVAAIRARIGIRWAAALCSVVIVGIIFGFLIASHRPAVIPNSSVFPRGRRLFARSTSEGRRPVSLNIGHNIGWLRVTPDGKKLFVIELFGPKITVIGIEDLQVKRRLLLPYAARGARMSRNGKHLYVGSPHNAVMIIGTEHEDLERVIDTGAPVFDLAVTPNEQKLFLAMGSAGLKRILLASGGARTISEFACPLFLDMDTDGKRLFVSYQCQGPGGRNGHDALEIYDTASEQRVGVINNLPMVGGPPVVSPQGDLVLLDGYDACATPTYDHLGCPEVPSHIFHLVRTSDRSVIKSFSRPVGTYGAAFSLDGTRLIFGGSSPVVMDWGRQTVTETLPIQRGSFVNFAFTPTGDRFFVGSAEGGTELLAFDAEELGCKPPPQGLADRYSGDGTFYDSNGVSALKVVGSVTFGPGLIGQAFQFTGEGGTLEGDRASACWSCSAAWTESFFTKFNSIDGEMTLLDRMDAGDEWRHRLFKAKDNRIGLQLGRSGQRLVFGSTAAEPHRWYHVALVANKNRRFLYITAFYKGKPTSMSLTGASLSLASGTCSLAQVEVNGRLSTACSTKSHGMSGRSLRTT